MENVQYGWGDGVPAEACASRGSDNASRLPNHKLSIPMMREKFLSQSHLPVYNSKAPRTFKRQQHDTQHLINDRREVEGEGIGRSNTSIGREHAVIKPNKRKGKGATGERSKSVRRDHHSTTHRNFKYLFNTVCAVALSFLCAGATRNQRIAPQL